MDRSDAIKDIFSVILSKISIHVTVVKWYHLPKIVTSNSVETSISVNIIEPIFMLENFIKLNL